MKDKIKTVAFCLRLPVEMHRKLRHVVIDRLTNVNSWVVKAIQEKFDKDQNT